MSETAPRPKRRVQDDPEHRRKEIAKIHLQFKKLGLDDELRRMVIHRITGQRSSADLTQRQRRAVLDWLAMEFRKTGAPGANYPGRPHNIDSFTAPRELKKIEAFLADAKRPWAYADALARRIAKVDSCAFLTAEGARKVLAALYRDAQRHGRRTA